MSAPLLAIVVVGAMHAGGCKSPAGKTTVLDADVLAELHGDGRLVADARSEEHIVARSSGWMARVSDDELAFAALRDGKGSERFVLVVECDPSADRLVLLPLRDGETPLDVLDDPARRAHLSTIRSTDETSGQLVLSLARIVGDNLLGQPVPAPRRIFGVAANFPSHLLYDLGVPATAIARLRTTSARVFQKHPPMPPPGSDPRPDNPFLGLIGPYDSVLFPDVISLPDDEKGVIHIVPTILDYEVELGFVVNRRLTSEDVAGLTDDALWECVAGYVLVSDIKARNPQVFGRIVSRHEVPIEKEKRYLTGDPVVDQLLGAWNEEICEWWGYAASQGNYAALGPYFVAAKQGERGLRTRSIASARGYAPKGARAVDPPRNRLPGILYLRQCARVSTGADYADQLVWDVPAVLRSILSRGSALNLGPGSPQLERGDVIALGTPGGVALTVKRSRMLRLLDRVLFWWDSLDWHNALFRINKEQYLYEGDDVFLWGEGLGYQRLTVHQIKLPDMPATIEEEDAGAAKQAATVEAEQMDLEEEVEKKQNPDAPPP